MNNAYNFSLRKALINDIPAIWDIIYFAKENMRLEGRTQWQDGYPAIENIIADINSEHGYMLLDSDDTIVCYSAVLPHNDENYNTIKGDGWITDGLSCIVIHRLAVDPKLSNKGIATKYILLVEDYFASLGYKSLRIDTNYDNHQMLRLIEKLNFSECGIVTLPTGNRIAFEKILLKNNS